MNMKVIKRPEWINLFDTFKDCDYDTIIPYEAMDVLLFDGSIKNNKRYVFDKFRKELLHQQSKALENISNKGYRIVKPNEHIRLTAKKIKQAEKRARCAADIILHVNYEALTDKERSQNNIILSRVQNVVAGLIGESKSIKLLTVHYKQPEIPRS